MLNARELSVNKCEPIAPRGDGMWQGRSQQGVEGRESGGRVGEGQVANWA